MDKECQIALNITKIPAQPSFAQAAAVPSFIPCQVQISTLFTSTLFAFGQFYCFKCYSKPNKWK